MEEQQPERESEVIEPARAGTWPRTSAPGVALGELFGDLASWKSQHGRETLPPLQSRRRDLWSDPVVADSTAGDAANGTPNGHGNTDVGQGNDTADGAPAGATGDVADGVPVGALDGAAGAGAAVGVRCWTGSRCLRTRRSGRWVSRPGGTAAVVWARRWGSSAGCETL